MRTGILLAWRLHRAELVAVAVAALGLSWLCVWAAGDLDRIVAGCRAALELAAPCGGLAESGTIYDNDIQGRVAVARQALAALPFAAGVVLGVPLLARELEHGTAPLSWPLARSRARWLALRAVPVAVIGTAILLVPAMAGEVLLRSLYPPLDPAANFEGYGIRGPLLILRFLAAFAAAGLVGAWIGRQLPALLLAGVVAAGIGIGLMQAQPLWVPAVEQPFVGEAAPIDSVGSLYVRTRYRAPSGEWMRDEDAWAILATAYEDTNQPGLPDEVFFDIPRERYLDVVARESVALAAGAGLSGWLLTAVVRRRRPG
jgi:hypothetical protein